MLIKSCLLTITFLASMALAMDESTTEAMAKPMAESQDMTQAEAIKPAQQVESADHKDEMKPAKKSKKSKKKSKKAKAAKHAKHTDDHAHVHEVPAEPVAPVPAH